MERQPVFICGAGPTGLSAALFLSEYGVPVRIIDKHANPSQQSRAFGINARTLNLLNPTGVTEKLLAEGSRMHAINVWHNNKRIIRLDLSKVDSKYNFLLINSQARTEELLTQALAARGVQIERNTELQSIKLVGRSYAELNLKNAEEKIENVKSNCVLAADGANSIIRESLHMSFPGSTLPEPWYFYDLELDAPLQANEGYIFLSEKSGVVMIRLKDNIWRLGGNVSNILETLPKDFRIGKILWETSFTINHRVVRSFSDGPVYFAGDCAHLHSPVGGRGMNLGIEDAFVFATMQANGRLNKYSRLRHDVVSKVVKEVERFSQMPRAQGIGKIVRVAPVLAKLVFPIFAPSLGRWILGLDHEVIPNKK